MSELTQSNRPTPDSQHFQKLKLPKEEKRIDTITQLVDLMEENKITLTEILDEWYLRRIG